MNRIVFLLAVTSLATPRLTLADASLSYISNDKPFISIKDVNRQAEAWGACSATYDIMALLLESSPAQAKQFKDFGNGASMAVVMTHVSDGLKKDMSSSQFLALWNYSKTLADSIPETQKTRMLADAEAIAATGSADFIDRISATIKVCMRNLEGQQVYIDSWRDLAKSGILTFN